MTVVARLAAFAAGLALVFAVAFAGGRLVGPLGAPADRAPTPASADHGTGGHGAGG